MLVIQFKKKLMLMSKIKLWIVDAGMSEAFNTDNRYYVQYLEILNDNDIIPWAQVLIIVK